MNAKQTPPNYSLLTGGKELLDRVGPLWLQLRQHHADASPRWANQLQTISFDARRAGLITKATTYLLVLLATIDDQDIGYCVSTIAADKHGEVDSLYIIPTHRKLGIGHALMSRTLEWFSNQSIHDISIDVIIGNETALPFYARYGFHPRTLRLKRPNPNRD